MSTQRMLALMLALSAAAANLIKGGAGAREPAGPEPEVVQVVLPDVHTLSNDVTSELWQPSPMVPQPIRSGG